MTLPHMEGFAKSVALQAKRAILEDESPDETIAEFLKMVAGYGSRKGYEFCGVCIGYYFKAGGPLQPLVNQARKLRGDPAISAWLDHCKKSLIRHQDSDYAPPSRGPRHPTWKGDYVS